MISVDLDSTLADTRHRQGMASAARALGEEPDWTAYALKCADDTPTALATLLRAIQMRHGWVVISGRSEAARAATEAWLAKHDLHPQAVFLEDGDTEQHTALGHTEWKARRVLEIDAMYREQHDGFLRESIGGITLHIDDWPDVASRIEELSEGRIQGLTVTPPGMVAAYPVQPDNPGEAAEVL